jgi:hypothetical protein
VDAADLKRTERLLHLWAGFFGARHEQN